MFVAERGEEGGSTVPAYNGQERERIYETRPPYSENCKRGPTHSSFLPNPDPSSWAPPQGPTQQKPKYT